LGYLSPPPSPQPVVVYKDVGGLVSDYESRTEAYRRENREVRLHECRSACTLALSLPNVCVYPDAQIKFHQAYNALTHEVDLGVSSKLFDSYPAAVRARLGNLTREYRVLGGRELIALGVRSCQQDDRTLVAARKKPPAPTQTAAANPLREFAGRVQVAVASALEGQSDAGATRIVLPDRSAIPASPPQSLSTQVRLAVAPPLPPRRPASLIAEVSPPPLGGQLVETAPRLIAGAQPVLPAGRFARELPMRAESRRTVARAGD
jgi:hypothetical protein